MTVEAGASLRNDAEVYTHTFVSHGEIKGRGTIWAHVSSKPIGGNIAPLHTIIYYGAQVIKRRYLQIMDGSFVVSASVGHGDIE